MKKATMAAAAALLLAGNAHAAVKKAAATQEAIKPGTQLICGMTDMKSKPWLEFSIAFSGKKNIKLAWLKFPFYGAEILPMPQSNEFLQRAYEFKNDGKTVYITWGGDGDAASAGLSRTADGYAGTITFPNNPPEGFDEGAHLKVNCTVKPGN